MILKPEINTYQLKRYRQVYKTSIIMICIRANKVKQFKGRE